MEKEFSSSTSNTLECSIFILASSPTATGNFVLYHIGLVFRFIYVGKTVS